MFVNKIICEHNNVKREKVKLEKRRSGKTKRKFFIMDFSKENENVRHISELVKK
mgnify:CR=1 FL=1